MKNAFYTLNFGIMKAGRINFVFFSRNLSLFTSQTFAHEI